MSEPTPPKDEEETTWTEDLEELISFQDAGYDTWD